MNRLLTGKYETVRTGNAVCSEKHQVKYSFNRKRHVRELTKTKIEIVSGQTM